MKTQINYTDLYSDRIKEIPKSFLREILKLTQENEIISFAGGLPNPECFPVPNLRKAAEKILHEDMISTLQYSNSEGFLPLRKWLADRYRQKFGWNTSPDEILITSGSQQGLDLLGKVFINRGENVIVERPSYLGAIQSLSLHQPGFISCNMESDGIDTEEFRSSITENKIKAAYLIPDFQNPTGVCYSENKRRILGELINNWNGILIEDNPYGEINFSNKSLYPIKYYSEGTCIQLGTFSKVIAPGLRVGWIYAPADIMNKIIVAKQASDLHSNVFSQKLIYNYLTNNDSDNHIEKIIQSYRRSCAIMLEEMENWFPSEVKIIQPEGGMFIWAKLPEYCNAWPLLDRCMQRGVAFVPGSTFYLKGEEENNSIRLNFTGSNESEIRKGIRILGNTIHEMLKQKLNNHE